MSTITVDSQVWKKLIDEITFIKTSLKVMSLNNGFNRWMTEAEVMAATDLSKRSLFEKRKKGVFRFSTVSGRKIKYLRKDVESYINGNSTLIPAEQ